MTRPASIGIAGALKAALFVSAALAAYAQAPVIGAVNVYGVHEIKPADLLAAAGVQPGGPLPGSKLDLEERISGVPNVETAVVEAVCCERGQVVLFIGIEEAGAPRPEFRSEPEGIAALPQQLVDLYREYDAAARRATAVGGNRSDASRVALKGTPAEQKLAAAAALHPDLLRAVIRNASDATQRAMAAAMIPLIPQRKAYVADVQFALSDPDPDVRVNALRSLRTLIFDGFGGDVMADAILPLLRSAILGDRLEAADTLAALTAKPHAAALEAMRSNVLPELAEMARWQGESGRTAFLLLGRIIGVSATEIDSAWKSGNRERIITRALATAPSPSR